MKSLMIAAVALILAVPGFATAKPTASAAQWKMIHKYGEAASYCTDHRTGEEGGEVGETKKQCEVEIRLGDKLKAQGFCFYAKSGVGRPGKPWTQKEWERAGGQGTVTPKGSKHCYCMHDPSISSYFHQC